MNNPTIRNTNMPMQSQLFPDKEQKMMSKQKLAVTKIFKNDLISLLHLGSQYATDDGFSRNQPGDPLPMLQFDLSNHLAK